MNVRSIIAALGGPAAVGRHCRVRSQAVSLWAHKDRIPADRVPELEALARELGVAVRAEDMRPDVSWGVLRQCEACEASA